MDGKSIVSDGEGGGVLRAGCGQDWDQFKMNWN